MHGLMQGRAWIITCFWAIHLSAVETTTISLSSHNKVPLNFKTTSNVHLNTNLHLIYIFAAPSAIIYDNSCKLHVYGLNRDPGFFKTCTFVIDRFHWKNHIGMCAHG